MYLIEASKLTSYWFIQTILKSNNKKLQIYRFFNCILPWFDFYIPNYKIYKIFLRDVSFFVVYFFGNRITRTFFLLVIGIFIILFDMLKAIVLHYFTRNSRNLILSIFKVIFLAFELRMRILFSTFICFICDFFAMKKAIFCD